ncbi:MAG: hypothetical protein AAF391_00685 [Bacteroidota bacterium]
MVFIFLILVVVRVVQSYFILGNSYYELKWLLLGEWLANGFDLYKEAFDYTGPLAAFVYKYLDLLFGRSFLAHHMINSLVVIIQAGIFNQLLLKNKAYDENSYLPALLYTILIASVPDFMSLSPQLLSLTFVLLAFRNILRRIDNQVTDELFLNTGLYIGIATMIYLPSAVFFLVFLFSLILFSTAVTRRLLLYFFGFLLVFALCALYFYWFDSMNFFLDSVLVKGLTIPAGALLTLPQLLIISSPFLFILLLSVAKTWSAARLTNFQQKIQQVIWLMFFGGLSTFFLSKEKSGHELVFMIPIIAYFWTFYFIHLKRVIFKFLMPGILTFGILVFSIYAYQNLLSATKIAGNANIDQKTMILGEDLGAYSHIEIATPCFNQHISKEAFEGLNYYRSSEILFDLIQRNNPDVIVDELGIQNQLLYRFPHLENNYKRTNTNTLVKISN